MPDDPRVDAYIARQAEFARPILTELRRRLHAACPDLNETLRWSMPSFDHKGKIVAQMAAFKAHATFGFWQREGTPTEKQHEAMGQLGRLVSVDELPDEATFAGWVRAAVERIEDPVAPKRPRAAPKGEAEVPPELAEALADDDRAAATFNGFPPSCRREYCEWIAEAKRAETRARRVAEAIGWLREGKRRNWKYEAC